MRRHLGGRVLLVALAVLLVPAVSVSITACGGGSAAPETAGAVQVYADPTYGYSFEYPLTWKLEQDDTASVTAGATAKANVGVYDPKGSHSQGTYFDLAEVSVYELKVTVDESMMPDIKSQVQQMFDQLAGNGGDWKPLDTLADATVGGLPGWTISYSFDSGNLPSTCRFYVVFGGSLEYQLVVQASTKDWEAHQPVFDAIVASFKPAEATTTTSE